MTWYFPQLANSPVRFAHATFFIGIERSIQTSLSSFRFKIAIADDQRKFIHANHKRPFTTYLDVYSRLKPYHISYEKDLKQEHIDKCKCTYGFGFVKYLKKAPENLIDKISCRLNKPWKISMPLSTVYFGKIFSTVNLMDDFMLSGKNWKLNLAR